MDYPNCTFSPEITKKAKEIVQNLYTRDSLSTRLHRMHQERRKKLMQSQIAKDEAEMVGCTFHPKTNKGLIERHGVV